MNNQIKKRIKEIAKQIDPDENFLQECENVIKERFALNTEVRK